MICFEYLVMSITLIPSKGLGRITAAVSEVEEQYLLHFKTVEAFSCNGRNNFNMMVKHFSRQE